MLSPWVRFKRNDPSKIATKASAQHIDRQDLGFDWQKLFKIRLSLGPISIKDHSDIIESLECSLALESPAGDSPFFLSTISEVLKVDNDKLSSMIDQVMGKSYYGPNHLSPIPPPVPEV
jgi:hypothetical protein